ncbi:MAG: CYTH domain-containing protein [Rhodospirillaceae bacterium]
MQFEIERRFLATPSALSLCHKGTEIQQGYLWADGWLTVRVRVAKGIGEITIKGKRFGCSRLEHETPIPLNCACALLGQIPGHRKLRKTRYKIEITGLIWEIDVFADLNTGLILAEIEMDSPDRPITLPPWIVYEITGDPRFSNSRLARQPYSLWGNGRLNAGGFAS